MGKQSRTRALQAIMAARRPIPFRELESALRSLGWTLDRVQGSHRIYIHPDVPRPLSVQPRGNEAKPYQMRQVRDMIVAYRLLDKSR